MFISGHHHHLSLVFGDILHSLAISLFGHACHDYHSRLHEHREMDACPRPRQQHPSWPELHLWHANLSVRAPIQASAHLTVTMNSQKFQLVHQMVSSITRRPVDNGTRATVR